ncbi:MAG: CoA-binding protein [Acidobacteria bacterium]|nr:CoA-binding protein [Acidobacteriota bacterium]MYK89462.1 CoA-binding protein [Acidobacteriota bacterium]
MRVAVIGASEDRAKFGNKAVRALRHAGHEVVPINPRCARAAGRIEGLPAYGSVADVPGPLDVATLYVHPGVGEEVLPEIAAKGIAELWVNPGAESDSLLVRARALGLDTRLQCSILAVDESPALY